jgi:hypothetical protein
MVQTHDGWVLRNDWFIEDVEARLSDYWDFTLTEDECIKVLELVADAHDANDGINWDAIDAAIESLYGDRGGQI